MFPIPYVGYNIYGPTSSDEIRNDCLLPANVPSQITCTYIESMRDIIIFRWQSNNYTSNDIVLHTYVCLMYLGSQPTAELVHGSNEGVVSHRSAHVVPGCRRGWLHHLVLLWLGLDVPGCLLQQLRLVYDVQHLKESGHWDCFRGAGDHGSVDHGG